MGDLKDRLYALRRRCRPWADMRSLEFPHLADKQVAERADADLAKAVTQLIVHGDETRAGQLMDQAEAGLELMEGRTDAD